VTLPELPKPEPASEAETIEALARHFAALPEYVAADDPAGPDYAARTAVITQTLYGLTVETIGKPLPF
jgi:predicted ABC-type transport system involved in lysophospholipase L1 biosynthesis ATPase subunit